MTNKPSGLWDWTYDGGSFEVIFLEDGQFICESHPKHSHWYQSGSASKARGAPRPGEWESGRSATSHKPFDIAAGGALQWPSGEGLLYKPTLIALGAIARVIFRRGVPPGERFRDTARPDMSATRGTATRSKAQC